MSDFFSETPCQRTTCSFAQVERVASVSSSAASYGVFSTFTMAVQRSLEDEGIAVPSK